MKRIITLITLVLVSASTLMYAQSSSETRQAERKAQREAQKAREKAENERNRNESEASCWRVSDSLHGTVLVGHAFFIFCSIERHQTKHSKDGGPDNSGYRVGQCFGRISQGAV